jgi:hypothetical protein
MKRVLIAVLLALVASGCDFFCPESLCHPACRSIDGDCF